MASVRWPRVTRTLRIAPDVVALAPEAVPVSASVEISSRQLKPSDAVLASAGGYGIGDSVQLEEAQIARPCIAGSASLSLTGGSGGGGSCGVTFDGMDGTDGDPGGSVTSVLASVTSVLASVTSVSLCKRARRALASHR